MERGADLVSVCCVAWEDCYAGIGGEGAWELGGVAVETVDVHAGGFEKMLGY